MDACENAALPTADMSSPRDNGHNIQTCEAGATSATSQPAESGSHGVSRAHSTGIESANPRWLRPQVLHLDTQCYDQHLINAFQLRPDLEELVLGLLRPDGLGKNFFNNMVARKLKGTPSSSVSHSGPAQPNGASSGLLVVPHLTAFEVRYRREKEKDEVKLLLEKIIQSREKTEVPLQSIKFWPTKNTPEVDGEELVPLRI